MLGQSAMFVYIDEAQAQSFVQDRVRSATVDLNWQSLRCLWLSFDRDNLTISFQLQIKSSNIQHLAIAQCNITQLGTDFGSFFGTRPFARIHLLPERRAMARRQKAMHLIGPSVASETPISLVRSSWHFFSPASIHRRTKSRQFVYSLVYSQANCMLNWENGG